MFPRFLENEIHKTNLKLMEGETIKKKYSTILDMLKKERLSFTNQLESLEGQLKKQDDEIIRLQKVQKAALTTREMARANQQREEMVVIAEGKKYKDDNFFIGFIFNFTNREGQRQKDGRVPQDR